MTDLIQRLKESRDQCSDCNMFETASDLNDAIIALEAANARIAELEAQIAAVAPAVDAQPVAGWQPIETAPEGKLLVVAWLDKDDPNNPERHSFDFIEEDGWVRHNEDYDHFLCVAPPGSRGPSADAPYTHWIELPEVPAALSKHTGEKDD